VGRAGQVGELVAVAGAHAGARVALLGRDARELAGRVESIALSVPGARLLTHRCDLADPAEVATAAAHVGEWGEGRVDALVVTAGGWIADGTVAEGSPDVWALALRANLDTAYLATRAFLPLLRLARGSIVHFASAAALPGGSAAGMAGYAAAKAGVIALVRAVAEEERAHGVRANALAPAAIRTASNEVAMGADARYVERDELARVVLWLLAEDSRGVTGQVLGLGSE
jgi:NAD(P)-dependent dehydrogenase (short-subunit alcohol dehydrogenase family)